MVGLPECLDVKNPPVLVMAGLLLVIRQSRAGLLPLKHRIGLQRRCVCAGVAICRCRLFLTIRDYVGLHTLCAGYILCRLHFQRLRGLSNIHLCSPLVSDNLRDFGLRSGRSSLKAHR